MDMDAWREELRRLDRLIEAWDAVLGTQILADLMKRKRVLLGLDVTPESAPETG